MKKVLMIALFSINSSSHAESCFKHAIFTPSKIQGELFTGPMYTNSGLTQVTLIPIFYRNASASDPWYKPSFAPLVLGGSSGQGSASGVVGSVVDLGPQMIQGVELVAGVFSSSAKQSIVSFFNCSASATACGALSAGVLANLTLEENGKFTSTWHELGRHPAGYFLGPSILFGGVNK